MDIRHNPVMTRFGGFFNAWRKGHMTEEQKPRRFDTTVRLQNLLVSVVAAIVVIVSGYMGLRERLQTLEEHDRQKDDRMGRMEAALQDNRSDTRDALRSISSDVKDLSAKFDQLKDQMFSNNAANRPEMKRWIQ